MATTPIPPPYAYYSAPFAGNAGFNTSSKPTQAAKNEAEFAVNTGGQLLAQQQALANQYGQQQAGVENYLQPLQETNASGQGGYNPTEASQIELTPQQQQDIQTAAGISAGQGNAAAVSAAERAYAATGGNPAALATYRARAAQSQGANAGQAETGAKVAAQQAGSAGAQAVGNQRIGQQDVGLQYFGNLQSQQGQQQATEQGLGNQTYGTEVSGLGNATGNEISAAGIPTTSDKIIGGIAGAASALLADGTSGYLDDGQDAVVGENGLEAVIEDAPKAVVRGASDPVRSHTQFMDEGHYYPENAPPWSSGGHNTVYAETGYGVPGLPDAAAPPETPLPAPQGGGMNSQLSQATPGFGTQQGGGMPLWLQQALANGGKQPAAPQPGQPSWNKTTPYSQLGTAIGKIASPYLQKALTPAATTTKPTGNTDSINPELLPDAGLGGPGHWTTTPGDINAAYNQATIPDLSTGLYADGHMPQYLDDGAPESSEYKDDPTNSNEVYRTLAAESMAADGKMMAGGRMGSGFHWSNRMPRAPRMPTGGYQPLHYDAKPMLSDGSMATPQAPTFDPAAVADPMSAMGASPEGRMPQNGEQVGRAKVFTKPTLIHLEKADAVVPLSYRPKAKVRPSAALPALMAKPQRRMYGAHA